MPGAFTRTAAPSIMAFRESFPPIARADARILLLGSMPGETSLRAGQYYAHPRNQFWSVLAPVTGAGPEAPYAVRVARLPEHGLARWDVAARCHRPGSLDTAIDPASVVPNDVAGLLAACPRIGRICFNGTAAATLFRRHILPALDPRRVAGLEVLRLPSTSPAMATLTLEQKRAAWRPALTPSPAPPG